MKIRFSLRALLAVTFMLCVALAFPVREYYALDVQAKRLDDTVAWAKECNLSYKVDASISYDVNTDYYWSRPWSLRIFPRAWTAHFGRRLQELRVTEDWSYWYNNRQQIRVKDDPRIFPRFFETEARTLYANPTDLDDATLDKVRSSSVSYLNIEYTNVHGEGLSVPGRFPKLQYLSVAGASIDDESLKHFTKISSLRFLSLRECNLTKESVETLRTMHGLKRLAISQCDAIDDAAIERLQDMPLESLSLSYGAITEASLLTLKKFPKLRNIHINSPNISIEKVQELKKHIAAQAKQE